MNNISTNLKLFRQDKGWTQQQLADKLYVTRQAVSNWENGKTEPDADTLIKLADVLEIDINEIIQGKSSDIPPQKEKKKCDRTFVLYFILMIGSLAVRITRTSIDHAISYNLIASSGMFDLYWKIHKFLMPLYAASIGLTEFTAAAMASGIIKKQFSFSINIPFRLLTTANTVILFFVVLHFTGMFAGMISGYGIQPFVTIVGVMDSLPEPVRTIKGFLKYSALMQHRRWHFAVIGSIYEFTKTSKT